MALERQITLTFWVLNTLLAVAVLAFALRGSLAG